jgi:hypothetical protein
MEAISWSISKNLTVPDGSTITYDNPTRRVFGKATVSILNNSIVIQSGKKKYKCPTAWIKNCVTTSVPPGGHLQYVSVNISKEKLPKKIMPNIELPSTISTTKSTISTTKEDVPAGYGAASKGSADVPQVSVGSKNLTNS